MHQAHANVGGVFGRIYERRNVAILRLIVISLQILILQGVVLGQNKRSEEKLNATVNSVEKLGQEFSCLREISTSRNTPDYWRN